MENKSIRPGYVPVTIELPAALAEEFQRKSYDWSTVVRLLLHEFTPGDIAETLLILYFEFTQQLAIAPRPPCHFAAAACHCACRPVAECFRIARTLMYDSEPLPSNEELGEFRPDCHTD